MSRPPLTIEEILAWADAHRARTGKWPTIHSGPVYEALDESWLNINTAMCAGMRGFTRRQTTLARLLAEHRGKRNPGALPPLTTERILSWAQLHHERTGQWPTAQSGAISGTEETWQTVEMALYRGRRGLAKSSLAKLLASVRTAEGLPTTEQILIWADAHRALTGKWPSAEAATAIPGSARWSWRTLAQGLRAAKRPTVHQLLVHERGVQPARNKPKLTTSQILSWADEHHQRTGHWPTMSSGKVVAAPHETWWAINLALMYGRRGLRGRSSLVKLLAKERGRKRHEPLPPLSVKQIREWARVYKQKHGQWPYRQSGDVEGAPGETWLGIFIALYQGSRGFKRRTKASEVFID